jgi:hypothetical protein
MHSGPPIFTHRVDAVLLRLDAAYLAREFVQASLPHSNPGDVPLWTRRNGDVTLAIQPGINIRTGKSYGYPYGTIPRLLLFCASMPATFSRAGFSLT